MESSMAMAVSIFLDSDDRKRYGKRGTVSAGRLSKDIERLKADHGGALVQNLPLRSN